jgi:hypothetical protein
MRYLTVGYRFIVFSPLLSLLLLVVARAQVGVTASIIGVQICGMILYLIGYRKPSKPFETPPHVLLSGIFLIIWGLLIAWYIITWHNFHILLFSDDYRTDTYLMDTIDLTFIMPYPAETIENFTFTIKGHNPLKQ